MLIPPRDKSIAAWDSGQGSRQLNAASTMQISLQILSSEVERSTLVIGVTDITYSYKHSDSKTCDHKTVSY